MPVKFAYKTTLFLAGWLFVLLGVIGAVLPILPTTPFLLLAAYCFSKSSPRVHSWLTGLPYFGDAIIDWERNRVIRPRAKILATIMIVLIFTASLIFAKVHYGLKIMLVCIASACLTFIWTRKSHP